MNRLRSPVWTLLAFLLVANGCEATRPTTTAVAPGPAGPPNVFLAPGGFLRFSNDLAMVVDGVMLRDSASAVAMGIRVESGQLFPRGTLTVEEASVACGVERPVAFLQTSDAPVAYSPDVPANCRPPE